MQTRPPADVTLTFGAEHPAVVAVVADTHSKPHPRTQALLKKHRPQAILHAGDIGELEVLKQLAKVAPVHAVRGNIDAIGGPPDQLVIDLVAEQTTRVYLTHIAVRGARIMPSVVEPARAARAQLVVCGHSHVPLINEDRGLAVFNPGSIGPRRLRLPITFGLMALEQGSWRLRHVSCETGETWRPGDPR